MLFLSEQEKRIWAEYAWTIQSTAADPGLYTGRVRKNLESAFYFYIGTLLAAQNQIDCGARWLQAGALSEKKGLFSSRSMLGFLDRHGGLLKMPGVAFEDPRPFIHCTRIPLLVDARRQMVSCTLDSLPEYPDPVSIMDIGCGDGSLTVRFLQELNRSGKVPGFREILLIDPSEAMIRAAGQTVSSAFPEIPVRSENTRIQDCSGAIDHRYDIALSSLAYHHMPVEDKRVHLERIKPWIDHLLLFELDANHDTPHLHSPELALSVYQTYGSIIDSVYAFEAPLDVKHDCVDLFWMTELISILTEPRGKRTEYHMLRTQWHDLFRTTLSPEFSLLSDSTCYAGEYFDLFVLHYGREFL